MPRSLLLAAAVAALAPALASCGGDDEREAPSEPPAELLRAAVADPVQSGVARIELDLALEGDSLLEGATSVDAEGPFALDSAGGLPSFDLAVDAEVAGFGLDSDLVSTGDDAFVVFFGENYRVGAERVAEAEAALGPAGDAAAGLDVAAWFEDPGYAGGEEVAGTATERVEGTLDAAAAAEGIGSLAEALGAPALIEALAAGARPGPIEAWVAYDDGTIRRLRTSFPFSVPPAQRARTSGVLAGTVSLDAEISDAGAEVTIGPPAGGGFQPVEQLISRLRDLASLGGL